MKDFFAGKTVFNARTCANLAFILFFSYRSWFGMLRLSRSRVTILFSIAVIYALTVAAARLSRKKNSDLLTGTVFLGICAAIFGVTLMIHPEYSSWYFDHPDYNLFSSVFYPTGGLFAFLFIMLCDDERDMRGNMKAVGWLMFIFAIYQLIPVILFGDWSGFGLNAKDPSMPDEENYSLSFGYRTIICLFVFWTEYRRSRDKKYLVLAVTSFVFILLFGGRGTLLAILLFFAIRYLTCGKKRGYKTWLTVGILIVIGILLYTGLLFRLLTGALGLLSTVFSSRSLQKLSDGSFFEDGARERIWGLGVELIKTGGIFGHGPYGDRMVIGQYYSWGYCHNVFLEMMVDFGVFGLLFMILFIGAVAWFIRTMDPGWRDMLLVFLGMSFQLLFSDSFWYNSAFWAVFALLLKHRKYLLSRTAVYSVCNPVFYKMIKERRRDAC